MASPSRRSLDSFGHSSDLDSVDSVSQDDSGEQQVQALKIINDLQDIRKTFNDLEINKSKTSLTKNS